LKKENIKKVVVLIDSKTWPLQTDIDMYQYLLELELPVVFVLSKVDRISNSEVKRVTKLLENNFFGQDIFPISSVKKTWIRDLEKYLKTFLIS